MELRHLRYFVAVAAEENFNRAARRIRIAQPALSRHIKALEASVGFLLFDRLPRGVRLTPAGKEFFERVQDVLQDLDSACVEGRKTLRGHRGILRVGYHTVALYNPLVTSSLKRYHSAWPDVEMHHSGLLSPEQTDALNNDQIDVGFLYATPDMHSGLHFMEIEQYTMVLGLPHDHPLAERDQLVLADLRREDFVWFHTRRRPAIHGPWVHEQMITECLSKGLSPRIVHQADGSLAILDMIAAGMGIGFVHPLFEPRRPDVVFKRVTDLALVWPLYMAWRKEERLPVVNSFVKTVLQALAARKQPKVKPGKVKVLA